jgi:hypothetical protein
MLKMTHTPARRVKNESMLSREITHRYYDHVIIGYPRSLTLLERPKVVAERKKLPDA